MIVGVVGAGVMGRGIAQVCAVAGHEVMLFDVDASAAAAAITSIRDRLTRDAQRGRLSAPGAAAAAGRVTGVRAMEEFSSCELVIEAVVEDLGVKRSVFSRLEAIVSDDCLLASNTSSLSVAAIAGGVDHRDRMVGLHFFNPVPAMKLVEIVASPYTSSEALEKAQHFVVNIGKTGVVVRDTPGFLVNLAGRAYATEALAILQDGIATIEQIDRIAKENLGFALGPFELMDLTGIDVNYTVTANLFEHNFADDKLRSTWYHRYLFDAGLLGRKTGRGFYDYAGQASPNEPHDADQRAVPSLRVGVAGGNVDGLLAVCELAGLSVVDPNQADLVLVAPLGKDCSRTAEELGLDARRTVAIDLSIADAPVLTMMVPPGVSAPHVASLAEHLRRTGAVELVRDSPGFIAQRILAAIVNLAAEIAQQGIAAPADIDTAMKLGLRYPKGPLEWGDETGIGKVVTILEGMHDTTGDQRYRLSGWLRRRAIAKLSCLEPDFS